MIRRPRRGSARPDPSQDAVVRAPGPDPQGTVDRAARPASLPTTGDPEAGPATGPSWAPRRPFDVALDNAVGIPLPVIRRHVASLRRRNPMATPAELVVLLEKEYTHVLAATGGAVGVAAALPSVGTGVGLVLSSSDVATFFASSAAFALAVAEVHGIEVEDLDRRRALLLASVLGPKGAQTVTRATSGGPSVLWGRALLTAMPSSTLKQVNHALSSKFVKTQLAKQAGLTLGRVIPFGVGAAVGWVGGRSLASAVVQQTRSAFGPAPATFRPSLRVVEGTDADAPPRLVARDDV
ncbi:hypothetical protein [Luteimicrobium subarcticum]|uniref:EcsC family protein n=1 Tax=Luteimicrobium subarcticum TaxID=620910 RepID=A0A2M8WSU6_9MICO|nr:hypothetical protein [Luteimicrobium subarcticum]PJI94021.1 hypothetical protein CLV34_1504 [Luteimicrobium subarcticum]